METQALDDVIDADHGMVPLSQIDVDGHNPRDRRHDYDAAVAEKVESMRTVGQLHPIRLYAKPDGRYLLGFGHLRLAAAKKLRWEDIRAEVFEMPRDPRKIHDARDAENLAHRQLSPLDEMLLVAQAIKRYAGDLDMTALRLGRSRAWVNARAHVARLHPDVQVMLAAKRIGVDHARQLAKIAPEEQREIAERGALKPDGTGELRSADWFRRQVDLRCCSLRSAPWKIDAEMQPRACLGCPSNTATDRTFFEAEDGPAFCSNPGCFAEKTWESERAIELTITRTTEAAKAAGGVATAEAIKQATPKFVRTRAVLAAAKVTEPAAPDPDACFVAEYNAWRARVAQDLLGHVVHAENPLLWLVYIVLSHHPAFASIRAYEPDPINPSPLSDALRKAMELASHPQSATLAALVPERTEGATLAGVTDWKDRPGELLAYLSAAWGLKVPPMPTRGNS